MEPSFPQRLGQIIRAASLLAAATVLFSIQAQACPARSDDPKIPARVQIINTNAGSIVNAFTHQDKDTVYVEGEVRRPSLGLGAHIHLWGLDRHHRQIFFKTSSVSVTGNPSFIRSETYIISVDRCLFQRAHQVFITFDGQRDDDPAE